MRTPSAMLALSLLLAFAAPPGPAAADPFAVPLPVPATSTCGDGCFSGMLAFHLPGIPAAIRSATLHVVGTTTVGSIQCDDTPGAPPFPWQGTIEGVMQPTPNQFWDAYVRNMPTVSGAFDVTATFNASSFYPTPLPDWSFLSGGSGTIEFMAGPAPTLLGCFPIGPRPTVHVTGAWIVFDADIPVATHDASWGRVKAMYR